MTATAEKTTLMTEGSIGRKIIAFALPLFLGNLFQQLYNTADSLIVGNFLGSNALAAVSSSGNLIFLMVGFFHGIAAGAGVVIARYYGARELKSVKKAVHTTIAFGLAAGIFLTIAGVLLTSHILIWMGTPADVLPESTVYFRIYFMGSLSFVMYNVFVGILQSVGDSRHPLVYLIVSSVINILLDLLFVGVLGFGVGAAAFATILSQFISAFLCLFRLIFKSPEDYQVSLRLIRFDLPMLRQIIANGLPAGFQNSIIALANVVVQSNINKFGKMAVAGCGAYSKIEGFGFLPITCFSLALTTFISQNLGAKQYERAKKGARFGILCSITMAEVVGIFIYFTIPGLHHSHPYFCLQPHAGSHRLRHNPGENCHAFLLFAFLFPLYRRYSARRRKSFRSHDYYALFLVYRPGILHHSYRPFYPGDQRYFLGLSPYLVAQLHRFFDLLFKSRLGAWF